MGLRARANDSDKSMTVRAKCVEELLTTEVDYGKLLKNVIEVMVKCIYFKGVFRVLSDSSAQLLFLKKLHHRCLTEFSIRVRICHAQVLRNQQTGGIN